MPVAGFCELEEEETGNMASAAAAYSMNGGDGLHSYTTNSTYQRGSSDATKQLMSRVIADDDEVVLLASKNMTIRVADMGCAVGPNTFLSMQNIVQSLRSKMAATASDPVEFQVFLNDHVSSDFNTLFAQSVSHRREDSYYVAGVPGSFHSRLFPTASLHVVHSSYALQWLSRVPDPVLDCNSPAWNKGEICYCSGDGGEDGSSTVGAYREQFGKDLGCFLNTRAREVVAGGLVLLVIPGRSNGTSHSRVTANIFFGLLGTCLMDMAHKGVISEAKVDSFNIPLYFPSPDEVEAAVEADGSFRIVAMECIKLGGGGPGTGESRARAVSSNIRAGFEALISLHFDDGHHQTAVPMDELFRSFEHKLLTCGFEQESRRNGEVLDLFYALKRKGE